MYTNVLPGARPSSNTTGHLARETTQWVLVNLGSALAKRVHVGGQSVCVRDALTNKKSKVFWWDCHHWFPSTIRIMVVLFN